MASFKQLTKIDEIADHRIETPTYINLDQVTYMVPANRLMGGTNLHIISKDGFTVLHVAETLSEVMA